MPEMTQHYVTGNGDTSFSDLAKLYGVSWRDIANLNFGTIKASVIYPWLQDHGGQRQAKDNSVPTGYHWSFSPGMVVNIPGTYDTKSPVLSSNMPAPVPGGPNVLVMYLDNPLSVGPQGEPVTREERAAPSGQPVSSTPAKPDAGASALQAGVGGGDSIWYLLMGALGIYFLFPEWFGGGKPKKTTRRKTTKRRKTRRRRRR